MSGLENAPSGVKFDVPSVAKATGTTTRTRQSTRRAQSRAVRHPSERVRQQRSTVNRTIPCMTQDDCVEWDESSAVDLLLPNADDSLTPGHRHPLDEDDATTPCGGTDEEKHRLPRNRQKRPRPHMSRRIPLRVFTAPTIPPTILETVPHPPMPTPNVPSPEIPADPLEPLCVNKSLQQQGSRSAADMMPPPKKQCSPHLVLPARINEPFIAMAPNVTVRHPSPIEPSEAKENCNDDEFGFVDFSFADFTQMDSLVKAAMEPPSITTNNNSVKQLNSCDVTMEEDPFGDVPDIDVEALVASALGQHTVPSMVLENPIATAANNAQAASDFVLANVHSNTCTIQQQRESITKSDTLPSVGNLPSVNVEDLQGLDALFDFSDLDLPSPNAVSDSPISTNAKGSPGMMVSRYNVLHIDVNVTAFTQTLTLARWTKAMLDKEIQFSHDVHHGHNSSRRNNQSDVPPEVAGVAHLFGEWYHTRVAVGDNIHIVSLTGKCRTDHFPLELHTYPTAGRIEDDLVIVVNPDMLLTPTTISETIGCTRRAVLKSRLGSTGLTSKAALFGTMRHSLFEETMKNQVFHLGATMEHIRTIVNSNAEGLLSCNASSREAEAELLRFLPQIQMFANMYTEFGQAQRTENDLLTPLETHASSLPTKFVAKSVYAVEEPIISPELGIKGNADMLVHAVTASSDTKGFSREPMSSIMGIELKTGHNQTTQNAHVAQLALYILMLQTTYGTKVTNTTAPHDAAAEGGLLLYLSNEAVRAVHIAPVLSEIKSLIGIRNVTAIESTRSLRPRGVKLSYESDRVDASKTVAKVELLDAKPADLPELLPNTFSCKKCFVNRECMMYSAASLSHWKGTNADPKHNELMHHFTGHLVEEEFAYFTQWDRLIDLEADASGSSIARSWLIESHDRESATSNSISTLVFDETISSGQAVVDGSWMAGIGFQRHPSSALQTPLSHVGFQSGCRVIVSVDATSIRSTHQSNGTRSQMHIVRGVIQTTTERQVVVLASRDDLTRMERIAKPKSSATVLFRIDKDETSTGIGTLRQNLVNLFTADMKPFDKPGTQADHSRLSWLRDVLIRLRQPVFDKDLLRSMFTPSAGTPVPEIPGCDLLDLCLEYASLNSDQKAAAEQVISAKDYSVIQGLPGTGKTYTIAFVARLLAALGKRVLITSYTHVAVDNVLLKLIECGVASDGPLSTIVRVGRKASCHPGVHTVLATTIAAGLDSESCRANCSDPSAESLRHTMASARIVGVTALTVPRSPLLIGEHFDVVIVDEAGQISQPAIIGALMAADSFVLVGDHMQLPPLVLSELATQGGYGVSMLKRLADAHPESVAQLTFQYRMHEDICQLSNDIVYKGMLKCANDAVAKRQLSLDGFPENLPRSPNESTVWWLKEALDPQSALVFLDTDKVKPLSCHSPVDSMYPLERTSGRQSGGNVVNDTEASLVCELVAGLVACGLDPSSIGVICPFRAQLRLLEKKSSLDSWKCAGLELSTIDRYQGRDKSAIVLSFVRSNTSGKVGRLLEDFRRLNVAVTRAKCKLILIGSYSTLHAGSDVLRPVLQKIRSTGRVLELPVNAV